MLIELSPAYVRLDSTSLRCALGVVILHRDSKDLVRPTDETEGLVEKLDMHRDWQLYLLRPFDDRRVASFQVGSTVALDHNQRVKLVTRREGGVSLFHRQDRGLWEVTVHLTEDGHSTKFAAVLSDYNPKYDFQGDRTAWGRLLDNDPFDMTP